MGIRRLARLVVVFALCTSVLVASAGTASAVGSVVINELMYHTVADLDVDEFLELHNPGDAAFDLSGMCFDGIDLCFDPGTSIAAGAYEVISPDAAMTLGLYGVTTLATYSAKLSNGGEAITLYESIAMANVVDQVEYDDVAPWPTAPDGTGPSLELRDPNGDNNDAANWGAAVAGSGHTAGALNSVTAGRAVINELMYHPASEVDFEEFLELHNPGVLPIDLSGACISDAVVVCFDPGTVLAGGGFAVISPDPATTSAVYGATTVATYTGKLGNGGETITLIAGDLTTVLDVVSYDDVAPWDFIPDGGGPSLELRDPGADNDDAAAWIASFHPDLHTAGAANAAATADPPSIEDITINPAVPSDADAVTVTARVPSGGDVELTYKVMFAGDVTIPMADDGVSGDGAAGDGVYGATIPPQTGGELVRYRIGVLDPIGIALSAPQIGDGFNYLGYTIADPSVVTDMPLFEWFMDPADWDDLITNHRTDDILFPAVLVYDGNVYDNIGLRLRGGNRSRQWPKPNFKIEFPSGHDFTEADLLVTPVDEFNLQAEYKDRSRGRAHLSWRVMEEAGFPMVQSVPVRLQQNGEFFGIYRINEAYDGDWRTREGYNTGAFWKADGAAWENPIKNMDKKTREAEGNQEILDFRNVLIGTPNQNKADFLWANVDVPALVNYMAATSLIRHFDQHGHNFYVYYDKGGSNRWSMLPWDFDQTWKPSSARCGDTPMYDPGCTTNAFTDAMLEVPEFRDMHYRRLRTMIDEMLAEFRYEDYYGDLITLIGNDAGLEHARWGGTDLLSPNELPDDIAVRRSVLDNGIAAGIIPGAQSPNPQIIINEIHYNPVDDGNEFIELYNPSPTEAIDLSGWTIDASSLTIKPGTVLLPQSYVVFVESDAVFSATHGGRIFVSGEYSGGFKGSGELVELRDDSGTLVDTVDYSDTAPWPVAPDGTGPSLELIDPSLDNSDAFSWAASKHVNGTPGAANDPEDRPDDLSPPTQPANVTAVLGTGTSIDVSWDASTDDSGAVEYDVYRDGLAIAVTASTTHNDTGVPEGATATYTVIARDAAGNLSPESLPSAPPVGPPSLPPTVPTGLSLGSASTSAVTFSWVASTDNSGTVVYDVYRDGGLLGTTSAVSYTDATVSQDSLYDYTVVARDPSGNESGSSDALEVSTPVGPTELIAFGDDWKFLDDGSNQGTAWEAVGFDDSSWDSGPAQLGYGDGDEATVVASGPGGDRHITTYFRHTLDLLDPAGLTDLTIELVRDDGAVVHVNGSEVLRSNMPAGTVDSETRSSSGVGGAAESAIHVFALDPAVLQPGLNVVAVEIHQRGPGSSDISFDLRMEVDGSFGPPDDESPTQPTNVVAALGAGLSIDVSWDGSTDNSGTVEYDLYRDGALIASTSAESYNDTGVAEGSTATYTVVAVDPSGNESLESAQSAPPVGPPSEPPTDPSGLTLGTVTAGSVELSWTGSSDNSGSVIYDVIRDSSIYDATSATSYTDAGVSVGATYDYEVVARDPSGNVSGASNAVQATIPPPVGPVDFIVFGDSWNYLDDGSNQGTAWRGLAFDDAAWSTGASELGYGENDEATVIDGGPSTNRYITTYFRAEFEVSGAGSFASLDVDLVRDDGAVVYINGTEVVRSNMPGGAITYTTRSSSGIAGAAESAVNSFNVGAGLLVDGTNVVAVEIHQRGPRSSDISFNLALTGIA